ATPTATPTPAFGPLTLSTSALTFSATLTTQSFTASEANYAGALNQDSATGDCAAIVAVTPPFVTGPAGDFAVTALASGSCTLHVSDDHGGSQPLAVTVP
ncbi:MAG: hypothetical protein DLM53_10275, partial [Candidatus Eremiobacter antarcticus]